MRKEITFIIMLLLAILACSCKTNNSESLKMDNLYPWCIVAFDSLERTPQQRIAMLKEMNFKKYAYDWRDRHLKEVADEIKLAKENDIEIISVWLWLNAKRDSLNKLSAANQKLFEIIKTANLKTTFWLSFSNNFFENLDQEQSRRRAIELIEFVCIQAAEIDCKVALYNHRGWFGNPYNQLEIIQALPQRDLKMVYNFHHAHEYIEDFAEIARLVQPYLVSVNLNGMKTDETKILPLGDGDFEKEMINILMNEGFDGPWGILGHIEDQDVQLVLEKNIHGLQKLIKNR